MQPELEAVSPVEPVATMVTQHPRQPLVLLRDTERSLRLKTLEALVPVLPGAIVTQLEATSQVAETSLDQLSEIDLGTITPQELRPARVQMGLVFVGFSTLSLVMLLFWIQVLHPYWSLSEQMQAYWYQYIGFVGLGVAGLFMLGREAMRPPDQMEQREPHNNGE
ncbi:hypothetical protein [Neosynechococcus sphagnicola]|uniref:hypothetical protein n=1 Tax=Neosynechococcus sphagnicola TaxID=1501145 RepID=UPI0019552BC8|nr:hypothetical protein [Neosynechococcus sphagnicola]